MKTFKEFAANEDGAITVDWVVLTAAIVGMGIAIVAALASGTTNVGNTVDGELKEIGTRVANGTVLN
ncbi:MAG: hypothetical protein AAGA47_02535 [Pseudomonadota bacterium]